MLVNLILGCSNWPGWHCRRWPQNIGIHHHFRRDERSCRWRSSRTLGGQQKIRDGKSLREVRSEAQQIGQCWKRSLSLPRCQAQQRRHVDERRSLIHEYAYEWGHGNWRFPFCSGVQRAIDWASEPHTFTYIEGLTLKSSVSSISSKVKNRDIRVRKVQK